jgi:hypothetical protein
MTCALDNELSSPLLSRNYFALSLHHTVFVIYDPIIVTPLQGGYFKPYFLARKLEFKEGE